MKILLLILMFLGSTQVFSNENIAEDLKQAIECKDASQNQLEKLNAIYRTNLVANLMLKNLLNYQ